MRIAGYLLMAYLLASIVATSVVVILAPPVGHGPPKFMAVLASPAFPYLLLQDLLLGESQAWTGSFWIFWLLFLLVFAPLVYIGLKRQANAKHENTKA